MQWFRSVHGAPTHKKWLAVSRKCGQPVPVVVTVVWALMDYASRQTERGSVLGFDAEDMDAYMGVDDGVTEAVIAALTDKEWLADGRIASWEDHQTKREDGAAERSRAWRERKRTQANAPNALDTDTDTDLDTDTEDSVPNGTVVAVPGDQPPKSDPLPVKKAFDNWNIAASDLGLPLAEKLTDERRRKIAVRLREYGIEGWNRALENLEASSFCRGENDRGWKANLDFLLRPEKFNKLLEGAYAQGDER